MRARVVCCLFRIQQEVCFLFQLKCVLFVDVAIVWAREVCVLGTASLIVFPEWDAFGNVSASGMLFAYNVKKVFSFPQLSVRLRSQPD